MNKTLASLGHFLAELTAAQHRDRLMLHAGALAYTTLLSLVPILTVLVVTAARLDPERAELLVDVFAAVLPFSPGQVLDTLGQFVQRTASLGWIAVTVSFLVTMNTFFQVEEVINTVWGVPQRRPWRWRLASIAAIVAWVRSCSRSCSRRCSGSPRSPGTRSSRRSDARSPPCSRSLP